jgi:hypothetical protein
MRYGWKQQPEMPQGTTMIGTWTEWKHYPKARGETIIAPIGPGIYEVCDASSGALFAFGAVDNVAQALAVLHVTPKSLTSWLTKREPENLPNLEYRTCATTTKAEAKMAAERMIGRRETYLRGAAA